MATKDYNSITDDYETPENIYKPILEFIKKDKFCLDVCASRKNIPADSYFALEHGSCGLKGYWLNEYNKLCTCFMNPPFKQAQRWIRKAFLEIKQGEAEVWCVIPADRLNMVYFNSLLRENNNWFIAVLEKSKKQVFNFRNPYISDEENNKNEFNGGYGKPIMILYIGENSKEYAKRWKEEQPLTSLVLQ